MASSTLVLMLLSLSLTPFSFSISFSIYDLTFHQCLSNKNAISPETFYTQNDTMFSYFLQSRVMNRRFQTDNTPKPAIIFLPLDERQIQFAVICARKHDIHLSGGHDYEGSSYTSLEPRSFVVLDLRYMHHVNVNPADSTVWVEAGAILGDLYYQVQKSNKTLGFPSSMHPSVGVGGYITGGGDGTMMRKYGLAADNVLDARIINADGDILDRASIGEDVFWAIRGGGGGSYGVIVSWKLKLVPVPQQNTIFYISRTLEQGATEILYKWQKVPPTLDDNLFLIEVHPDAPSQLDKMILTSYYGHFLGDPDKLLEIINENIPELGLKTEDCREMTWHEAINGGRHTSYEEASSWGTKYFKDNFKRLAQIKTQFDPSNFFYHQQTK